MCNARIATLTFHRTTNYGAIFQTYALQKALDKLGYSSEVLDYRCPTIESRYNYNRIKYFLNLKNIAKCLLQNSYIRDNRKSFHDFSDSYIRTSKESVNNSNIASYSKRYGIIIAGSDQIWNPECTGYDSNYFLSFTSDSHKESYAASLGRNSFSREQSNWLKNNLGGFKRISVRETSSADIIKTCTGKSPSIVVDPTILLHDEWLEIGNSIKCKEQEPYILIYAMSLTGSLLHSAKQYAKNHGYRIILINDWLFPYLGVKNKFYTTPIEWLNYFINAKAIFTNSFHGTAFSVNLQKQFFVELLPKPIKSNGRIIDFLKTLELQSRIIDNSIQPSDMAIDYSIANALLSKQIEFSYNYLKNILNHGE